MQKKSINTSDYHLQKIIHISLFIYLFLLIFPHTTTLREISFWTASIFWVILRIRKQEGFMHFNPITISLSVFLGIAFISSVIGEEPFENLKRFKGELLAPFIIFFIAATEFNSIEKVKRFLISPVFAFAIYTSLLVIESTNYGMRYFWDKANREQYIWLANYSQTSSIIFPLTLGFISLAKNKILKYFLITFGVMMFTILTAYTGISVFLGSVSVLLLWIICVRPKKYRLWMIVIISLLFFVFGMLLYAKKENPAVIEYRGKFEKLLNISGEFNVDSGFSNRMPAWKAAVDIIKGRPLLGYGWGIKKFKKLVQQEKFLEEWKVKKPYVYFFYTEMFRDVLFAPHNIFLEIAVQSGLLGLAAFLIFIGIYLYFLIKTALHNISEAEHNFFIILVLGTIMCFMISNIMNNYLGTISGKILFAVLGTGAAWMKDSN